MCNKKCLKFTHGFYHAYNKGKNYIVQNIYFFHKSKQAREQAWKKIMCKQKYARVKRES